MPAAFSAEVLRHVLASAPDAMIICDRDGAVLLANHQATTLFGYSRDEFSGLTVEALLPERFRERHVAHRERYAADPCCGQWAPASICWPGTRTAASFRSRSA